MIRRTLIGMGAALVLLLFFVAGTLAWIGGTEQGTRWAVGTLARQLPALRIAKADGTLFDSLRVQQLRYRDDSIDLTIAEASLRWHPLGMLQGMLAFDNVSARGVRLSLRDHSASAENSAGQSGFDFTLPFNIKAHLALYDAQIVRGEDTYGLGELHSEVRMLKNGKPHMKTTLQWRDLTGKQADKTVFLAAEGDATLTGWTQAYRLALQARTQYAVIPEMKLQLNAAGDMKGIESASLHADTLGGKIDANLSMQWSQTLRWDASVYGDDIDPGNVLETWPGSLAFTLKSHGTPQQFSLRLSSVRGTLRGLPVHADADASWEQNMLVIKHAAVRALGAHAALAGRADAHRGALEMQLFVPRIAAFVPDVNGSVDANMSMQGPWEMPRGRAKVNTAGFAYKTFSVAHAGFDVASADNGTLHALIDAEAIRSANRRLTRFEARADGTIGRHAIRIDITAPDGNLSARADGGYIQTEKSWHGSLERLALIPSVSKRWRLEQAAKVHAGVQMLSIRHACLSQDDNPEARFCLDVDREKEQLDASAHLHTFPMDILNPWLKQGMRLSGAIDAEMELHGTRRAPDGYLKASVEDGAIFMPEVSGVKRIGFSVPHCEGWLKDGALRSEADAELKEYNATVNFQGSVATPDGQNNRAVRAEAHLLLPDLEVLQPFIPSIHDLGGKAEANVSVTGSLRQPSVSASAVVNDAAFTILQSGTHFEHLNAEAMLLPGTDRLNFEGRSENEKGWIALNGSVTQLLKAPKLGVFIEGKNFKAVALPNMQVRIDPALHIVADTKRIGIEGNVTVPEANIAIKKLPPQAVSVSEDAVIVGEGNSSEIGPGVDADLLVTVGEHVNIEALGLKGRLAGVMRLTQHSPNLPKAVGTLRVEDGTFDAYGLTLALKKGVLNFAGPVDNPGLDIVAQRQSGAVTAILMVTGTAKSPLARVSSDPPMTQADALSWLLTGHGLDAASRSDAALLAQALYAMNSSGDEGVLDKIKQKTGLDEIGVEGGSDIQQSALVLGTYLTPDIYVRYTTGLFDYINTVSLIYRLNRHVSVELQSGAIQAMDIWYDIDFGGR